MKKIFFYFLFVFSFFLAVKPVFATVGSPCCPSGVIHWLYNPQTNQCENASGGKTAISCQTQDEICNPGPPDLRGTCISKSGPTPPGITCGNSSQPCCPGVSDIARRICVNNSVPSDPFSANCTCLIPTSVPSNGGDQGIDFGKIQSSAFPSLSIPFQIGNTTAASKVGDIISTILPYLFVFAGLILLFYLIAGGFQMMLSAGDEKALGEAKKKITNALFGFLLLFVSYWLVQIIEIVLGITIF